MVFVGTFTAGDKVAVADGQLAILRDGAAMKLSTPSSTEPSAARKPSGAARPCSSPSAASSDCARKGSELIEIAPGVDLQKDILDRIAFQTIMKGSRA